MVSGHFFSIDFLLLKSANVTVRNAQDFYKIKSIVLFRNDYFVWHLTLFLTFQIGHGIAAYFMFIEQRAAKVIFSEKPFKNSPKPAAAFILASV